MVNVAVVMELRGQLDMTALAIDSRNIVQDSRVYQGLTSQRAELLFNSITQEFNSLGVINVFLQDPDGTVRLYRVDPETHVRTRVWATQEKYSLTKALEGIAKINPKPYPNKRTDIKEDYRTADFHITEFKLIAPPYISKAENKLHRIEKLFEDGSNAWDSELCGKIYNIIDEH